MQVSCKDIYLSALGVENFYLVTIISRLLELTMDNKYITDYFFFIINQKNLVKKWLYVLVIFELISVGTLGKSS